MKHSQVFAKKVAIYEFFLGKVYKNENLVRLKHLKISKSEARAFFSYFSLMPGNK